MSRVLLVGVVMLTAGCVSPSNWFHSVSASIKTPHAEVKQAGDVAQPAQVTTSTTKTELPIPAGAKVSIEIPVPVEGKPTPPPVVLSSVTTTEHVVAPTSFQPPAPPTPAQLADGQMKVWFWIGLIVGGAAALFGLVRGWNMVMYGGLCVAGACAFGIFVQNSPWLLAVIGLGVALKIAGPTLYHTVVKKLEEKQTPPTS